MGEPDPDAELADIRSALEQEHTSAHEPVFRWKYRYPLFLAITIGAFNQLAGINAILYYLPSIFASAGFSQISGDQQAIAIGFTNLIFTMVGMSVIDKTGPQNAAACWRGGHSRLPGSCLLVVQDSLPLWRSGLDLHHVYSILRSVARRSHLGLYRRSVSQPCSLQGQGVGNASHWIMNTIIALEFPVLVVSMGRSAPLPSLRR